MAARQMIRIDGRDVDARGRYVVAGEREHRVARHERVDRFSRGVSATIKDHA